MSRSTIDKVNSGLDKRYRSELRFRFFGIAALVVSALFLVTMFGVIIYQGWSAFYQTAINIEVYVDPALMDVDNLANADYNGLIKAGLRREFPEVKGRRAKKKLYGLVSSGASFKLRELVINEPSLIGCRINMWVPADDDVDMFVKGRFREEGGLGRLTSEQVSFIEQLKAQGRIKSRFNKTIFRAGDSRDPELAGIRGALAGSFYTLLVTLALSFPLGVAAAVYLEEFAPANRWSDIIEVNINNLAAVPSIVFGLLGLAIFLNFFGLPRSSPLVGGLVLTLMTLPTIIIASRAALKSVPPSIREAALGVGASPMQAVFHHVLPLALPGMLTGTIIGMAQALGETAPLLMIGMVAFIVDIPQGLTDPAAVLPVQIYLWSDSPERGFVEKTSAAIMILLAFLIAMNGLAIYLRKKFERKW